MSSSELIADWLFGTGFISLAPNPLPVEEQPVVRTTVDPPAPLLVMQLVHTWTVERDWTAPMKLRRL